MAAAELHFCSSGLFIFNTGFKQRFPNPGLANIKYIVSLDHTTYSYNLAEGWRIDVYFPENYTLTGISNTHISM